MWHRKWHPRSIGVETDEIRNRTLHSIEQHPTWCQLFINNHHITHFDRTSPVYFGTAMEKCLHLFKFLPHNGRARRSIQLLHLYRLFLNYDLALEQWWKVKCIFWLENIAIGSDSKRHWITVPHLLWMPWLRTWEDMRMRIHRYTSYVLYVDRDIRHRDQ